MTDFYLDNDVSLELAPLLRRASHHVIATRDLGLFRASDDAQLLIAARNLWTIVTYNRRDFTMLHDAWITWPSAFNLDLPPHSGIIVLDPGEPSTLASGIDDLPNAMAGRSLANQLLWWHRRDGWRRRLVGTGWEPYQ